MKTRDNAAPIMVLILMAVCVLAQCEARADEYVASKYVDSIGYVTADEAARAALTIAAERSEQDGYEWGGLVFEYDSKFYYTEPVTSGSADRLLCKPVFPSVAKAIALYHTHVHGAQFSNLDEDTARAMRVSIYMLHIPSGDVRLLKPRRGGSRVTLVGG